MSLPSPFTNTFARHDDAPLTSGARNLAGGAPDLSSLAGLFSSVELDGRSPKRPPGFFVLAFHSLQAPEGLSDTADLSNLHLSVPVTRCLAAPCRSRGNR